MRIFKISLFFIAAFFSFFEVGTEKLIGATGGTVTGIIRNSQGVPLGGAVVTLLEGRFNSKVQTTVTADGEGKFEIKNLLPGLYSLKVNVANYAPLLKSGVRVVAGKIADLNLILENLYQQSVLGGTGNKNSEDAKEDIESVLRAASSTRPILRIFDSSGESESTLNVNLEANRGSFLKRNDIRGVVNLYTTAYSADPDLMNVGGTFTEFALIKDVNPTLSWAVAGVASDAGLAEIDSMIKLRDINGHNPSIRLSLGQLPYLSGLFPVMKNNLQRLNLYNLDVQDELKISSLLSVMYGAEFQVTDPAVNARKFRPRWRIGFEPTKASRFSYLRTTSLPRMNRTLDLAEGENLVFASPFQHEFGNRLNFGVDRVTHTEVATEQKMSESSLLTFAAYTDDFSNTRAAILGISGNQALSSARGRGIRLAYRQGLSNMLDSVFGYTCGAGIRANEGFSEFAPRNFHVVTAKLIADFSQSKTQVATTYRWISGYSITVIDPYQEVFESSSPGMSLRVTQAIPYFGKFIPGKLEAQLDIRTLFARNDPELYTSAALKRLEFTQPPKSVRGGIKLKF